jgi:hypothetical protein
MTKTTSSSNSGCLIVIFPFAVIVTVLFIAWRVLLTMLIGGLGWRLWQNYQWKQFSLQINPFFHSLLLENQGSITPLDLALKANISGISAKNYLEAKAEEFGAQRQEYEGKGTVYYFLTSGTLGRIFDDSEPVGLFSPVEENSIKSENLPTEQEIKTPVVEEIVSETKIITSEEKTEEQTSVIVDSETEITSTSEEKIIDSETEITSTSEEKIIDSETEIKTTEDKTDVIVDSETEIKTTVTEVVTNLETESVEISVIEDEKNDVSESVQEPIQILTVSGLGQILDESEPDNLSESKVEDSQNVTTEKKSLSLYQKDLAERLGVSSSTILKYRGNKTFANWSKGKDPEGIAWQYSPKTGFFTPVDE